MANEENRLKEQSAANVAKVAATDMHRACASKRQAFKICQLRPKRRLCSRRQAKISQVWQE